VRVRFLADADLNKAIVSGVLRREPSIDFLTAQAAGLRKMKDLEVLALAAGQQRVLVSHDVGTMLHFRAFKSAGNSSPCVFLAAQTLDIGTAIEELLLVWLASKASEWENRLARTPARRDFCQSQVLTDRNLRSASAPTDGRCTVEGCIRPPSPPEL